MKKLDQEGFVQIPKPPSRSQPSSSHVPEGESKDCIAARKSQKADREKMRRDRLNEQFIELGNVLDPDRPKNDKATILSDTIQLLKELASQVNKLKAEYSTLNEESRELTQEKSDLREEKASLKSDIESLNGQYQQRARTMYPWPMDHSVMMAPPSYPYPVPMPMPTGPIPMHPHMQPYPFYGNQNTGVIPNPCSTYVPYIPPSTMVDHHSQQHTSPTMQPVIRPSASASVSGKKQESGNKSAGENSKVEKSEGSNDVATNLELKTPGSATDQDASSGHGPSQSAARNQKGISEKSSSSRCSSPHSVQDSSSNSIISSTKAGDS